MSNTESYVGRLIKLNLQGKSIEGWCIDKLSELSQVYQRKLFDNPIEQLQDCTNNDKYIFTDNNIYEKFIDYSDSDFSDIYYMKQINDNQYEFVMQFYNGGTCLNECLEEKIAQYE